MWCWWCCHPFDNEPLQLPYGYDDRRKKFSTTGNFTDFGDLIATLKQGTKGDLGSSTRGVRAGGILASDAFTTSVEFVTMASQGNAIDYGDCTTASRLAAGASNSVKSFLFI